MSIMPNWLEIDMGTGGVTIVDSFDVEIVDDTILVEMEAPIRVDILDDTITVEIK